MAIRFGVCADISDIPVLVKAGYDYLEYSFQKLVQLSDDEYQNILNQVKQYNMKVESCNCFFAAGIRIVGDDVNYEMIEEYAEKGMKRFAALGGSVAVVGSGKARTFPEGYDYQKAYGQFMKVLDICGNVAGKYGIQIAVEPLQKKETNLIHTVSEGIELCKQLKNPNVKCLVDFYHVFMNGEPLDAVEKSEGMLIHAHLARPNIDRCMPREEDMDACRNYAKALGKCGYAGRMSLEGNMGPDLEATVLEMRERLSVFV